MKTFSPTPKDINREWFVVDAQDKVLGRLAAQIAHRLQKDADRDLVQATDRKARMLVDVEPGGVEGVHVSGSSGWSAVDPV